MLLFIDNRPRIFGRLTKSRIKNARSFAGCGNVQQAWPKMHPDIDRILFTNEEIQGACMRLGSSIASDYADKAPILLSTLSGAFMFTAELCKHITPVPIGLTVDFLRATSYGSGTTSSGQVAMDLSPMRTRDLDGRHVIILEDIVDTGRTASQLVEAVGAAGAASVEVCSLLDKAEKRVVPLQPKYVGMQCPDAFVVGFGLDYAEHYRTLPYIGVLKPDIYARKG